MGGVSLGTIPEEAEEGAGMVRWTIWSGRRMWVEATQAPVELMLSVFGELDELGPGSVRRAQEDGHLQANARGPS